MKRCLPLLFILLTSFVRAMDYPVNFTVIGSDGNGLENVKLIISDPATSQQIKECYTDANGEATTMLPPGKYQYFVEVDLYLHKEGEFNVIKSETSIQVSYKDCRPVSFHVSNIEGNDAPDVIILVHRNDNTFDAFWITDANGRVDAYLPEGEYTYDVGGYGYAEQKDNPLTVGSTGASETISYATGYYSVQFTVKGYDGSALVGASMKMYLLDTDTHVVSTKTNAAGICTFYLPPDDYDVYLEPDGYGSRVYEVNVESSNIAYEISYQTNYYPVTITIIDADNNGIEGLEINIFNNAETVLYTTEKTGNDGKVTLYLRNGAYICSVGNNTYSLKSGSFTVNNQAFNGQMPYGEFHPVTFSLTNTQGINISNTKIDICKGAWPFECMQQPYTGSPIFLPKGDYTYYIRTPDSNIGPGRLSVNDDPINIDLKHVSGLVTNTDGDLLPARVQAYSITHPDGKTKAVKEGFVDALDGHFDYLVGPGGYFFYAEPSNKYYLSSYQGDPWPSPPHWQQAEEVTGTKTDPMVIALSTVNRPPAGVNPVTIAGRLVDNGDDGSKATLARPVAYVTVILYGKPKQSTKPKSVAPEGYEVLAQTQTDTDGNFSLGEVPRDYQYQLHVEMPSYTMIINDYIMDPEEDGNTAYNVNCLADVNQQIITIQRQLTAPVIEAVSVNIYPNPATGMVEVTADTNNPYTIRIFSTTGQQVLVTHNNIRTTRVNIENLPAGIYLLRVETGKSASTLKLVVQ